MMGRDVVFDMANERIGFVEAVCDLYDGEDGCDSDEEETEARKGQEREEDRGGTGQGQFEDAHGEVPASSGRVYCCSRVKAIAA